MQRGATCGAGPGVEPDPQLHLLVGSVSDLEVGDDSGEQVQRHVGDLCDVAVSVLLWQPRHHHVGVADGLHLDRQNVNVQMSRSSNFIQTIPRVPITIT